MIVRKVEEKDVAEITKWFESVKWPLPPVENILPHEGFIAELDSGKPLACAWFYTTGTSLGLIDWTNTNPDATEAEQKEGLDALVEVIQGAARFAGVKVLTIYTRSEKFASSLKKHNFRSSFGYHQATWVSE